MIHFASNCLLNFALSLAKIHAAIEPATEMETVTINATNDIDSIIVSTKLLAFPSDVPKEQI